MRDVLSLIVSGIFLASWIIPFCTGIPHGWEQYVGNEQGAATSGWLMVLGWYFGSAKKDA